MDPEAYPWHPTHNHNLAHEYSNPLTHKLPGDCYHRYEPKVIQLVRLQCNGGLGDSLLNVVQLQERKAFAQIDPIPWFYYPGMRFRIQVLIVILLNKLIIRGEEDMNIKEKARMFIVGTLFIVIAMSLSGCGSDEPEPVLEESAEQEEQQEMESDPVAEEQNDRIQYVLYLKHRDQPFIFSDSYQISETDERLNNKSLSEFVLEELIKQDGVGELINPIPDGTEILSVEHEGRLAIVNLSREFIDNINGTEDDIESTIAMIVNSLITLPENDRVRLLVEGEAIEQIGNLPIQSEYEFITTYYPDK